MRIKIQYRISILYCIHFPSLGPRLDYIISPPSKANQFFKRTHVKQILNKGKPFQINQVLYEY